MVASPAARRFRTQLTSPQGHQTHRRPVTSMIATADVCGWPVLRPRIVMSPLKPNGRPARNSVRNTDPKAVTERGARAAVPIDSVMVFAPACWHRFRGVTQGTRGVAGT